MAVRKVMINVLECYCIILNWYIDILFWLLSLV